MPSERISQALEAHFYPPEEKPNRRTTMVFHGDVYDLLIQVADKLGMSLSGVVNMLLRAAAQDALEWVDTTGFRFTEQRGLTALGATALEEWLVSDSQLQELQKTDPEQAMRYISAYASNLAQQPGMAHPQGDAPVEVQA